VDLRARPMFTLLIFMNYHYFRSDVGR
jgi:hypothetical protein